jgi:heterodisulfide reductase subunit C/nitrate reductase gamma subunit
MTTQSLTRHLPHPDPVRLAAGRQRLAELLARVPDFLVNAILQRRVLDKPYAGLMHLLLFWGVTIQVVGTAINLMQMKLVTPFEITTFPRGGAYLGYELVMDLAGVAILLGVALALFRRLVLRPKALVSRWDDYYALLLLGIIPLVGFTTEATRLLAMPVPWAGWSPVGQAWAGALAALGMTPATAVQVHAALFWAHVSVAVLFVATIPFTKLRHLVDTPLHIFARPRRRPGTLATLQDIENAETLGVGTVREFTSDQLLSFDACLRCGRCEETCPVTACGVDYTPKDLVQALRSAMVDQLVEVKANGSAQAEAPLLGTALAEESLWQCTTCGACISRCPAFVNPVDALVDLRRYQVMTTGKVPKSVADVLRNMERQFNPWGMPPEDRADRAAALGIRVLGPGGPGRGAGHSGAGTRRGHRHAAVPGLCLRLRRAQRPGGAGLRAAAQGCRRGLRYPGRGRPVLRRVGAAHGARVSLSGAGAPEHRAAQVGELPAHRHPVPPLLQHLEARVPGPGRRVRGAALHRVSGVVAAQRAGGGQRP